MFKSKEKSSPKDKRNVYQEEAHEVKDEKISKQAARKFGKSKEDA